MAQPNLIKIVDLNPDRTRQLQQLASNAGLNLQALSPLAHPGDCASETAAICVADEMGCLEQVLAQYPPATRRAPVLAYASEPRPNRIVETVFMGVDGYLAWPFDFDELLATLENARARRADWVRHCRRSDEARRRIEILSKREKAVLRHSALGLQSREIGQLLEISKRTAEVHRANILRKLGLRSTVEAARLAIEAGMLD